MVVHCYNPSTREVEAAGLVVQGQAPLHSKFKTSLGSIRCYGRGKWDGMGRKDVFVAFTLCQVTYFHLHVCGLHFLNLGAE